MLWSDVFVTADGQISSESFDVMIFIYNVCLHLEKAFETVLKVPLTLQFVFFGVDFHIFEELIFEKNFQKY